ncbi:MAG: HerA-ATP synthase, barrel domain protein [candidate division TM6 bacterium GW2011_GWF2_36_6]|nr:MAG: HerA-ATP synthase, barrel domain protein [candidate division TM6 bacterium GW2011_GWF2_36_6]
METIQNHNNLFSKKMDPKEKSSREKLSQDKPFFAELIDSNLQGFTAQCWKWDNFAEFGSLIQVDSGKNTVLGCVTQVQTGSQDPMRSPFPYQKTEAELLAEQPQIFEFLRTTFTVQILGYIDKNQNKIFYLLPPVPCKIHSFAKECSNEIVEKFFKEQFYLHILFKFLNQNPNFDELLLAILNRLSSQNMLTQNMLEDFYQTLSLLTGNDYRRLKLFLTRVEKLTL